MPGCISPFLFPTGGRRCCLVALTPFALALCGAKKGLPALAIVGVASALLWFFGNLFFATYNGVAVLALALLHAGIIVACGASLRWWYRATRLPLALLLPITFVAGEFLRLLGPLGVPTGLLALSFHEQLWMIQIADLGGIYLVSFAIASVNGALADVLLGGWKRARFSVAGVAAGWIAIACYGAFRLHESQQTMQPGPVIGVVQSDIPMTGGIEHGFDSHLFLQEMLGPERPVGRQSTSSPTDRLAGGHAGCATAQPRMVAGAKSGRRLARGVAGIRARVTRLDNARGHSTRRGDRGRRPAAG